jgi:hypothetical protein
MPLNLSIDAMRLWSFLPIIAALHNIADATPARAQQIAARSSGTPASILTPDFVDAVQKVVDSEGIPGLTLAVVYKNGSSELGAWGIKSEDGTKMTTDVRNILGDSQRTDTDGTTIYLLDAVQYRLLFKSLSLCFYGNTDRRFCPWT